MNYYIYLLKFKSKFYLISSIQSLRICENALFYQNKPIAEEPQAVGGAMCSWIFLTRKVQVCTQDIAYSYSICNNRVNKIIANRV
jgi:hypothetical protein